VHGNQTERPPCPTAHACGKRRPSRSALAVGTQRTGCEPSTALTVSPGEPLRWVAGHLVVRPRRGPEQLRKMRPDASMVGLGLAEAAVASTLCGSARRRGEQAEMMSTALTAAVSQRPGRCRSRSSASSAEVRRWSVWNTRWANGSRSRPPYPLGLGFVAAEIHASYQGQLRSARRPSRFTRVSTVPHRGPLVAAEAKSQVRLRIGICVPQTTHRLPRTARRRARAPHQPIRARCLPAAV